jgi:hypothetical protein
MKKKTHWTHWASYIILVVALVVIVVTAAIGSKGHRKENFTSGGKREIWGLSFSGGEQKYIDAVKRITREMQTNTTQFDKIVAKTDADLKRDPEFWPKHGDFINANTRGYGYWLWKPYLIMKTLEIMNDGDILFYVDSGCELLPNENNDLEIAKLAKSCDKNTILYIIASEENQYNKMDLVNAMILEEEQKTNVMNTMQNAATFIIMKKTDQTYDFASEWYSICCTYSNIDDSPSKAANDPSFIEHRHDQSVFSLLTKSEKYRDTMNTPGNKIYDCHPFLISRKRSG